MFTIEIYTVPAVVTSVCILLKLNSHSSNENWLFANSNSLVMFKESSFSA